MTDTKLRLGNERLPARTADTLVSQTRGHMFRRKPPEWALVFRFGQPSKQSLHMLFVPFALDAVFVRNGLVEKVEHLKPWTGTASGVADTIIELPAETVSVAPGDAVEIS